MSGHQENIARAAVLDEIAGDFMAKLRHQTAPEKSVVITAMIQHLVADLSLDSALFFIDVIHRTALANRFGVDLTARPT